MMKISKYLKKIKLHIENSDFPNDSFVSYQWPLKQVKLIKYPDANGEGITIGVIDTVIDFEHEDLRINFGLIPLKIYNM